MLAFWRIGMASLLAACLLWIVRVALPQGMPASIDVLIGVLALPGFAGSIINGMLYKIVPFLAWFHLQSVTSAGRAVPNMKGILGEAEQRRQLTAHVAALGLLAAAAMGPTVLVSGRRSSWRERRTARRQSAQGRPQLPGNPATEALGAPPYGDRALA